MKKYLRGQVKEISPDKKSVRVVASSGAIDREGDRINPNGWDFSNFTKNPQLLWSHDAFSPPIGRVERIWQEGGTIMADTVFAEAESEFAALIARLVRGGFVNAVSVGFLPKQVDPTNGEIVSQELLELSFVNIPANQEALVVQRGGEGAELVKQLRAMEVKMLGGEKSKDAPVEKQEEKKSPRDAMAEIISTMQSLLGDLDSADGDAMKIRGVLDQFMQTISNLWDICNEWYGELMPDTASKQLREKVGRVISEKNRNEIRLMVDACKQASEAGQKLLDSTESPDKKGADSNRMAKSSDQELKALRIVDRAVEILIQARKETLSREKKGGVT